MDPKDLLLRHFEKIVLGLFGAFLGWIVFSMVSSPAELKENDKIKATIDKIDTHMKTYAVELPKIDDPTAELQSQLEPTRVPSAEPFPGWLVHRRPNLAYSVAAGPQKVYPKHEPPTDFHIVEKGRGRVKLAWKASAENEYVNIVSYELLRKDNNPEAEWKSLAANIDANKTEFEDTTVAPRSKYWYRLKESAAAQLDNPVLVRDKTDLAPEKRDLFAEDTKDAVETPQDIYITIDGGEATDPVNDKKGEVQCKVWRWNATLGKFVSKAYLKSVVGAKIGAKEKAVKFEGKNLGEIDFATDATLLEVTTQKRKIKGNERDVIVARVKWPWGTEEDLVEKDQPPEIAAQTAKPK